MRVGQTELLPLGNKQASHPRVWNPRHTKVSIQDFQSRSKALFDGLLADANSFLCCWRFWKIQSGFFFFPFLEVFTITDSKVWLRHTLHKVKLSPLSPSELFSTNISSYFFLPNPFTSTWVIASLSDSDTAKWSDLLISLKDCSRHSSI